MTRTTTAALLTVCCLGIVHTAPAPAPGTQQFDLSMPGVTPQTPDTYLCHAAHWEHKHSYITGFIPKADSSIAHHILLYGCEEPGQEPGGAWNCGEMSTSDTSQQYTSAPICKSGSKIIYAWAMDAPKLTLPPDVSFDVGQDTNVKYLVLQVHYKNVSTFLPPVNGKDNSGITLETADAPVNVTSRKQAGVFLLFTGGYIPAHSVEYFEAACPYTEDTEIVPFAFRTHAHSHGRVISGYRVRDGEWTEIGRKDPRLPEMFYNVTSSDVTVKKGDILAARCTMENELDHTVNIGNTQNDEMCNFYIMYYVDSASLPSTDNCGSDGPPGYYWGDYPDQAKLNLKHLPSTASVIPGTDQPLIRNTTDKMAALQTRDDREESWMQQEQFDPVFDPEFDPALEPGFDQREVNYLVQQLETAPGEELGEGAWPQYQQDMDRRAYYQPIY